MKILAIADLHLETGRLTPWRLFIARARQEKPELLIVAGDLTAGSPEGYVGLLRELGFFEGPKLFVPGNHDLWQARGKGDTWRRYQIELPAAIEEAGWHYLDAAPFFWKDIAFIGCIGWYDYSFRQRMLARDRLLVSPAHVAAPGEAIAISPKRAYLRWEELKPSDYATKALQIGEENLLQAIVWNDVFYVDWGRPDEEMAAYFVKRLRARGEEAAGRAASVVAVTHFVAFGETLPRCTEIGPAYARAFAGAQALGETLQQLPSVRLAIFGHWHRPGHWQIGTIHVFNVSVGQEPTGGTLIDVSVEE